MVDRDCSLYRRDLYQGTKYQLRATYDFAKRLELLEPKKSLDSPCEDEPYNAPVIVGFQSFIGCTRITLYNYVNFQVKNFGQLSTNAYKSAYGRCRSAG
jgi:hypothetical protein